MSKKKEIMSEKEKNLSAINSKIKPSIQEVYTVQQAINELDELKKIALNCYDKNGNPNLSIALRIIDCKA